MNGRTLPAGGAGGKGGEGEKGGHLSDVYEPEFPMNWEHPVTGLRARV